MPWEDRDDELTPKINKDFGSPGFCKRYDQAYDLVNNRPSKGALISLVAYLLKEK